MKVSKNQYWDIFCQVVDNYGDIGICWRLSQQLASEYKIQVRLFINDMVAAKHIIATRERLNRLLAKATGQPLEKIEKDVERDYFMTSDEAKKYGLVDTVYKTK